MTRAVETRRPPILPRLAPLAVAAMAAALPGGALACSVCACGDPLLDTTDPAANQGALRLQLEGEWLSVASGSEVHPGMTDDLTQYTLRANAVWGPTDRLNLVATVPLVRKDMRMTAPGVREPVSDTTALGDVEAGARYTLWSSTNLGAGRLQDVAVSAGTSFPTGENRAKDAAGVRIDEHGQPGTGSWGPYAGVHYHLDQRNVYAFASLSGRMHTENAFHYRYGSALLWSVHGQVRPVQRLALDLGVDGRFAGRDRDPAGAVPSTGGLVVAASPGAYLNVGGGLWLSLRAQLPFWTALSGEQTVRPTVVAGVQYQLF